jgi:uncharacterized protein YfdQ (DUF2303 family)
MSMDKSAIQQIQESQTMAEANATIDNMALLNPVMALPNQFSIHDLENNLPGRVRFRGKMDTININDFIRYCGANDKVGSGCFVDPMDMTAKSFFNLGTEEEPGHADFTASLTLNKTPEFNAVLRVHGQQTTQKNLAEFMEDWQGNLAAYDSEGEIIHIGKAISAVRRITIESFRKQDSEVGDLKASKSAMESVEAKSDDGLPSGLMFMCVPYNGLVERTFDLRMSILTGGDSPVLVVRIKRLEVIEEEMSVEFMELLQDRFEDREIETYLGNFSK